MDSTRPAIAVYTTASVLLLALTVRFFYRGYQIRKRFRKLPGPPHSWLFGHLAEFPSVLKLMPYGVPPALALRQISLDHGFDHLYFLDAWPISGPTLVSCSRQTADQFTSETSQPKSPLLVDFTDCIGGQHNIVVDSGPRWKTWRSAFNPGFSNAHLMTLVPDVVDTVSIFAGILSRFAAHGEPVRMEKPVTRMAIDIMGKVILDVDFGSQLGEDTLVSAFESTCKWFKQGVQFRPSEIWDFRRPYIFWRNSRIMDSYIDNVLLKRWQTRDQRGKSKYVIDLALETYLKDKGSSVKAAGTLDPDFRRDVLAQIKVFLFAGHDTTATTISYCYYHFSRRPEVAAKLRDELDRVFGKGADIGQQIRDQPTLLNKLEYMMAFLKETLRFHAPANSLRRGGKGFFVTHPETGEKFDCEGVELISHAVMNHMHKSWKDPNAFRPERWLDGTALDGAWIPFSKAPRSCIGQELALIEARITLAMTLGEFDFSTCFDELDKLKGDGSGYSGDTSGIQELWGLDAYPVGMMAKPREGMPLRVKRREKI